MIHLVPCTTNETMQTRWFTDRWVPELLLPPNTVRMFGQKRPILPPKYALLSTYRPCRLIWCPFGWWLWCAGCISQDTYLLYPARARWACALRALGLLLADGTPTGGRGEDFLSRQLDFFTETAVTPERKVEKSFPRWEINRHGEG